jgi:Notch-like protein
MILLYHIGYTGETCDSMTSSCSPNPCGTNRQCLSNSAGGYTCVCASGYSGESCDKRNNLSL